MNLGFLSVVFRQRVPRQEVGDLGAEIVVGIGTGARFGIRVDLTSFSSSYISFINVSIFVEVVFCT